MRAAEIMFRPVALFWQAFANVGFVVGQDSIIIDGWNNSVSLVMNGLNVFYVSLRY